VTLRIGEKGPLVASLLIDSDAPGCKRLLREVRVVAGLDHVELFNLVDKARLEAADYRAKEGKESVNFAFPFNVPDGRVTIDVPLGLVRVEADQMPSACKNWLTVGRFADVTSEQRGITWVTLDAPLVQVGGITARLLNSQTDPNVWQTTVEPTQRLYSWAMNNHWGTNYRAYQEGPTMFRFILRPHGAPDLPEAERFATGSSQPLLCVRASGTQPPSTSLLRVEPSDILVTALKPADDGKGWIVRLFNAGSRERAATLTWSGSEPAPMSFSNTAEHPGAAIRGPIPIPPRGLVTVRLERGS
jgi:hypothetical protein